MRLNIFQKIILAIFFVGFVFLVIRFFTFHEFGGWSDFESSGGLLKVSFYFVLFVLSVVILYVSSYFYKRLKVHSVETLEFEVDISDAEKVFLEEFLKHSSLKDWVFYDVNGFPVVSNGLTVFVRNCFPHRNSVTGAPFWNIEVYCNRGLFTGLTTFRLKLNQSLDKLRKNCLGDRSLSTPLGFYSRDFNVFPEDTSSSELNRLLALKQLVSDEGFDKDDVATIDAMLKHQKNGVSKPDVVSSSSRDVSSPVVLPVVDDDSKVDVPEPDVSSEDVYRVKMKGKI